MIGIFHIVLAMKPTDGNFADNALKHGVTGLNIAECRIGTDDSLNGGTYSGLCREKTTEWQNADRSEGKGSGFRQGIGEYIQPQGRWPANVIHDGSADVLVGFPITSNGGQNKTSGESLGMFGIRKPQIGGTKYAGDSGSAARFFKQIDEFQLQEEES